MYRPFGGKQLIVPMSTSFLGKYTTLAQEMIEKILGKNMNKVVSL